MFCDDIELSSKLGISLAGVYAQSFKFDSFKVKSGWELLDINKKGIFKYNVLYYNIIGYTMP